MSWRITKTSLVPRLPVRSCIEKIREPGNEARQKCCVVSRSLSLITLGHPWTWSVMYRVFSIRCHGYCLFHCVTAHCNYLKVAAFQGRLLQTVVLVPYGMTLKYAISQSQYTYRKSIVILRNNRFLFKFTFVFIARCKWTIDARWLNAQWRLRADCNYSRAAFNRGNCGTWG